MVIAIGGLIQRLFVMALLISAFVFNSCQKNDNQIGETPPALPKGLPEVMELSKLKGTQFVPALEEPIPKDKNIVYASALLYAWDKIEQELPGSVSLNEKNSRQFTLVSASTTHENSLKDDEYSAEATIEGDRIAAKAFFHKALPFTRPLQPSPEPLQFGHEKVAAFVMYSFDYNTSWTVQILVYNNDNDFILKLNPQDTNHQILLIKGLNNVNTLGEAVTETRRRIASEEDRTKEESRRWRYSLLPEDVISIPVMKFNLETMYSELAGQSFKANGKDYFIESALQRTGLVLDKDGAIVESEGTIAVASAEDGGAEERKVTPKRMIFDKPFYIILKRVDQVNPYFVMKVDNPELMVKQ